MIKLSLAYSFRKMFFIGQNLKHVHMTYSFLELLIFFWLTQVDIYCLEFISHHITEILHLNTNSKGNQSWNKNKDFHLFLSWKTSFFNINIPYGQSFFLSFKNTFLEVAVRRCFFKVGALKDFAIFWIKKRLCFFVNLNLLIF